MAPITPRYHALDRVRASAMLLGVLYHTLMFEMFFSGPGMGPMGGSSLTRGFQDWLHSFRMPLFFLISGFFGRMMLDKYGTRTFLAKRWGRIGVVFVIGMFTFSPLYIMTRDMLTRGMPGPGGPPGGGGGPPRFENMPPPPPGFGPPPFARLDNDAGPPRPPGGPGGRGPGRGGPPGFGPPGGGPAYAGMIFGRYERYVQLHHLWFLWYLLVFVTVAPFLTRAIGLVAGPAPGLDDPPGWIIRLGLAPVLLGLASTPALALCSNMFGGVGLGLAPAIFRAFPDFVIHPDPDMLFYFLAFMAGWWLHRERSGLPVVARFWLPNLLVGLFAFWLATGLGDSLRSPSTAHYGQIRWMSMLAYCLGSAFTSFAFLGFFQHYLDRPNPVWRYLADTALWVYLIHQPLVIGFRALVGPLNLDGWLRAGTVWILSVVFALMLYEAIVRPTPLVRLFGPSGARKLRTTDEA